LGKHPAANDYIRLGDAVPLIAGLADWVGDGYAKVEGKKRGMADAASWRFWTKGSHPGELACGIVRDSSDRFGRPYPLLLIGTGTVRDWERHWDLLPYACLPVWERAEYLGAQRYEEIGRFESAVRGLSFPVPEWAEFSARRAREAVSPGEGAGSPHAGPAPGGKEDGTAPGVSSVFVRLDGGLGKEPFPEALGWLSRIRRGNDEPPNAVFFGGTLSTSYLGVFRRRLSSPDFARIWNMTAEDGGTLERGAH
jgi:type VI secretion system protein VasJ